MESDLLSIGAMARASGLSVSALRFYDGAGVLVPTRVDPETGYRWYAQRQLGPARLVASLRRVGMPLAQITLLLDRWPDPTAVRPLLDAHLRRLEGGLADARRELARVHGRLDREADAAPARATRLRMSAEGLAGALDAVRFAAARDHELPALGGILFETEGNLLRLVATDRYRLAVSGAPLRAMAGAPLRVVVPVALVDEARRLLGAGPARAPHAAAPSAGESTTVGSPTGAAWSGAASAGAALPAGEEATVTVEDSRITIRSGGRVAGGDLLDHDFPDHRRLVAARLGDPTRRRVLVDAGALRTALCSGEAPVVVREHGGVRRDHTVLTVGPDGDLALAGEEVLSSGADHVGVNREFLLDALDAGGPGQLVLELDGPIQPLAVRVPGDEWTFSLLMPVRLG